jgi:hypothetical protein
LENYQRKLKQRNESVSFEKNSKGLILKLGSLRSDNYSRICQTKNSFKFEHEMKGKFIQNYHKLLVLKNLQKLEQKLSTHFLNYFGQLLSLFDSSTD